ncbi:MAG: LuxR C-terminal-related transcriptional regulator [Bacteroidota bacterium]
MKQTIFVFSLLALSILLLFRVSKYALFSGDVDIELVIALVAITGFFMGIYLNKKSFGTKQSIQPSTPQTIIDYHKIKALRISDREYEVLLALSENLTNKEIAARLFISESTTKSHVSRLLSKLEASNRIKAVEKAKALQIL